MIIHLYAKLNEPLSVFDKVLAKIKSEEDELYVTCENKRSFSEFEKVKSTGEDIVFVVPELNDLGMNESDVATRLSWFIDNAVRLVICEIASTYEFGIKQTVNQAVLSTVLQSLLCNKNVITASFKRNSVGRNRLPFPDNWDELYEQWYNKKITSKEFISLSGLKKASFYNLLTEYKEIQEVNKQYLRRYTIV